MSDNIPNFKVAWDIYKELLYHVPYNSITHLYQYLDNEEIPLNYGLPCVLQLDELVNRFAKAGFSYVRYADLRHTTIIVPIEGKEYLFDPYLLHSEPICLTPLKDEKYYHFKAFPYRKNLGNRTVPSQFRFQIDRKKRLMNSRYAQFQVKDNKFMQIRRFRFSLNHTLEKLPPASEMIPLFFHPEQTTLSIRVLCKSDSKIYQIIYPLCWYFRSGMHSPSNILIKLNDGETISSSSAHFQFFLEKIAWNIELTKKDIIDFIMGGIHIYEKHAPKVVEFHKYKPIYS